MSAPRPQLFSLHERVQIPVTVLRTHNTARIHHQVIDRLPFVRWPSGQPCEPVNAYLLDTAATVTGDTLKTYAAELSPLLRYCDSVSIGFEQLDDTHIFTYAQQLQTERALHDPTRRMRNNNTVRNLMRRAIAFLQWYQAHLMLATETPLIGSAEVAPRIIVRWRHTPHGGRRGTDYVVHRAMPTTNSRQPKHPLPQSIIEEIERVIESLSDLNMQTAHFKRRFARHPEHLTAQLEYLRARRRFMVWIMKRTGLRPSEMHEMPLRENATALKTQRLIIPTKKRRHRVGPLRSFPVTLRDAAIFHRYLIARETYAQQIRRSDPAYQLPEALFLGVEGEAVKKTSLEKDFERLVRACGHRNVQACLSMFRHRFITFEVVAHLREFMGSQEKTRQLMTDADYRSILKRVSAKTGHGSPESLWHYIDLAWEEMDVWAQVDRTLEGRYASESLHQEVLDLQHQLKSHPSFAADGELEASVERLAMIVGDAKKAHAAAMEPAL